MTSKTHDEWRRERDALQSRVAALAAELADMAARYRAAHRLSELNIEGRNDPLMARISSLEAELAASERYRENLAQGHVGQAERIRALEAELIEAKLQRDSWKRIAESGLGLPQTETGDRCVKCDKPLPPLRDWSAPVCPACTSELETACESVTKTIGGQYDNRVGTAYSPVLDPLTCQHFWVVYYVGGMEPRVECEKCRAKPIGGWICKSCGGFHEEGSERCTPANRQTKGEQG